MSGEDGVPVEWKGFALGETALVIDEPLGGGGRVYLCLQFGNDVYRVAQFFTTEAAQQTQAWLEAAISAVGNMNNELVQQIREFLDG